MLRRSSANRVDMVTDCVIEILAEGGFPAVTLRVLADRIGVTPSGVFRWFDSTDLMWESVAARFGWRWVDFLTDRTRSYWPSPLRPAECTHDIHGFLPGTDDEVVWTRVWLALVEVGRHDEEVGKVIARIESEERALIGRFVGPGGDPLKADALTATVRGLRHAICSPERPMPVRTAHAVLAHQWRA